jgi:cation diffusion facilitator CzcD-associated flavoprotein CzcO
VLGQCLITVPPSQFTWARNPNWSRFYSSSEEIWQYFKDVSTKYDLERYVKMNTKVESATWDEEEGKWRLSIVGADGSHFEDSCEILVNGSGVLK